jgi:hypothetical protein
MTKKTKFIYTLKTLDGTIIVQANTMHDLARKYGTSIELIETRLKTPIFKHSQTKGSKNKFNVTKEALNG